ncbi:MAG: metallophosphoesterase [Clostridia bacterium]|nr:metallophosphoesterase [Clostridia bacterium]
MNRLLSLIYKPIVLLLSFYFVLSTLSMKPEPQTPLEPDAQKLGLALFADVHMEGNNQGRFDALAHCFKNLNAWKDSTDALVLLGDNTMNGFAGEYLFLYSMLEHVNPISRYYTIVGNHDVGNSTEIDFDEFAKRNLGFMQTFNAVKPEHLYYADELNGCRLIFLAPNAPESAHRTYGTAQLDFLEAQLQAAAAKGQPVFVFSHFPSSRTSDDDYDRYIDLLNSYDKIFVIVGHMHYYVRYQTVEGPQDTPEIWVPCISVLDDNEKPNDFTGRGFRLEVYSDRVVFRLINYYRNEVYSDRANYDVERTYSLTGDILGEPEPWFPPIIAGAEIA